MARIPEGEIERLKAEVAVERLAEARGIALERHGADLIGLCPFHDDREPSLVITPESVVLSTDSKNAAAVLIDVRAGAQDTIGAFNSAVWLASEPSAELSWKPSGTLP